MLVSGMKAWMKYSASAYALTTSTAGAAGPCKPHGVIFSVGVNATRGDRTGNRPVYQWQASAPGALTYCFDGSSAGGGSRIDLINVQADGGSVNNVGGINVGDNGRDAAIDCVAINCNGTAGVGFGIANGGGDAIRCRADTCTTGFSGTGGNGSFLLDCDAVSCGTGFSGSAIVCMNCLARSCTSVGLAALPSTVRPTSTAPPIPTRRRFRHLGDHRERGELPGHEFDRRLRGGLQGQLRPPACSIVRRTTTRRP